MAQHLPFRLILASGSHGRRYLMEQAGYTFTSSPPTSTSPTEARLGDCRHYVARTRLAQGRRGRAQVDDGLVIAADTVGWLNGKVVGKPEDEADARRIIKSLSGTVHELWTGVCLWLRPGDWQFSWQERSLVRMKPLTDAEIDAYLEDAQVGRLLRRLRHRTPARPLPHRRGGQRVSNVIGLPMESLEKALAWLKTLR